MTRRLRLSSTALALGIALSLSACGGGGGNVRPNTPPPPPPPAPAPAPTTNYTLPAAPPAPTATQAAHGPIASDLQSNLTTNSARGLSLAGQGQIIGIVDTGVDGQTQALQGKVAYSHCYVCDVYGTQTVPGSNPPQPLIDPTHADWIGHGTGMATAMVGQAWTSNGSLFDAGIAPDAKLYVGKISFDYGPDAGMNELGIAQTATADLFARGAKVINNSSAGGGWIGSDATTTDYSGYASFHDGYAALINAGALLVFSAGNDSKNNPAVSSSMPSLFNDTAMEKGWVVVAALDPSTGLIAGYSNHCGAAQDYCITANGTVGAGSSDSKDFPRDTGLIWKGTSVAAPAVTATAALVWQAFPWMTNDQVRQSILGSATDLGAAGVDSTYGWGLLNTGRAIQGPGQFAWGDFQAAVPGGTSTFSNDILGRGGLVKTGAGTLVLSGNNGYTGATSVTGGTLQVEGTVRSNVSVAVGGQVSGQGIVAANLTNAGTVLSANKGLSVLGTYTQVAGGDLSVQLGAPLLTSQSVLQGGTLTVVGVAPNYVTKAQETVLWAKNGLTGHFDSFKAGTGVMLTATLNYLPTVAYLDISRVSVAGVAAAASNDNAHVVQVGQQVEQAFQTADVLAAQKQPLTAGQSDFLHAAALVQQAPTLAAAGASIQSLSGESHATTTTLVVQSLDVASHTIGRHLNQASPTDSVAWADTYRGSASLSAIGYAGATSQNDGLIAGVDRALTDQDRVGAALTSGVLRTQLHEVGGRNEVKQIGAVLYARHDLANGYLQAQVGAGHLSYDIQHRTLLGITSAPNTSHYAGQYQQAQVEIGHERTLSGGVHAVESLAVLGTRVHTGAFTERGTPGFNVVGSPASQIQWGTRLGMALRWDVSWGAIDFATAWTHDFRRAQPQIGAHYEGTPLNGFDIHGMELARDRLSVGAGLTANLGHGWQGTFHYDVERLGRDGGRAHQAQVGIRWNF